MKNRVFEGTVTALSSIAHSGGQSFGINTKLRRERFVQTDGSVEEVPVVSGNGIRGMLRDRGMLHMLHALGYGVNEETGEVQGLSLPAFHFLFSGGALTAAGGQRSIDVDQARSIKSLIPLVGIFGGAMGNQIMPGKLKCGKLIPICRETQHLLPEAFRSNGDALSIWDYLQEEMYTRKDDSKGDRMRHLLDAPSRTLLDGMTVDEPVEHTGEKQQMMYYVETFAAGTRFHWKLVLDDVTDLEFDAFLTALVEFSRMPYVGGKSNIGLGEVAVNFDRWVEIDSRLGGDTREIGVPAGAVYQKHLREKAEDIRSWLSTVA